jgi:hypothetical protein
VVCDGGDDVSKGEMAARIGIAAVSGAVGVGAAGRVAGAAIKGAKLLTKDGAKVLSKGYKAASGAAGGAAGAAVSETGMQANNAISGEGFDGGAIGDAAISGAEGGAVFSAAGSALKVVAGKGVGTEVAAMAGSVIDKSVEAVQTGRDIVSGGSEALEELQDDGA